MQENEYRENEKVLYKTRVKLSLQHKEPEEVECFVTEGHVVIEAKEPIKVPLSRIKDCQVSTEWSPVLPTRAQQPLTGTMTLTFLDDLEKKRKISFEAVAGDLYSLKGTVNAQIAKQVELPFEFASFWRRLAAYVVDGILVSIISGIISGIGGIGDMPKWWGIAWGIVGFLVAMFYYVGPYSRSGQTVGKSLLGIKVAAIDGVPLNWRKGFLRYFGYIPSAIVFFMGFLWLIWDRDKQAWHDKIAGTCVVRDWVTREELREVTDVSQARRRQKRWLLGLGIPALLIVLGCSAWSFSFLQSSLDEVGAMGPWPGPEVSPREAMAVDLSHLGLNMSVTENAQKVSTGLNFSEGIWVTYKSGNQDAVYLSGYKYDDIKTADKDFEGVQTYAQEHCGAHTWVSIGTTGVAHCEFSDAYEKIFWNDYWIVDIVALEGTEFTPAVLVDKVRDAIANHWVEMKNL